MIKFVCLFEAASWFVGTRTKVEFQEEMGK